MLTGFLKKNSHLNKWAILGPKMMHPHNSGSAVRIFLKFLHNKGSQWVDENDINILKKKKKIGAN